MRHRSGLPDGSRFEQSRFTAEARQAQWDGYFTFNSDVESFAKCFAVPVRDQVGDARITLCVAAPREDSTPIAKATSRP